MIRFGVVLSVALAAFGLLVGGVLTSSLLLVYLAIAVAALGLLGLIVFAVIWRAKSHQIRAETSTLAITSGME